MREIAAIAAMTGERVIGRNNSIPWHYPEDFKRFKRVTMDGILIMGRKTWESIGSKSLPGRRNIVISRGQVADIEHYQSIEAAMAACEADDRPVWFIGGGQVYADALAYCTRLDITRVPDIIDPGDAVLFPEIDPEIWREETSFVLEADSRLTIQLFTRT